MYTIKQLKVSGDAPEIHERRSVRNAEAAEPIRAAG
jgi:hypothetical protein